MSTDDPHGQHAPESRASTRLARAQDRVASAFDIQPGDRSATVAAMIAKSRRQPASYWLQLMLAMGIATFGLVLGSTAVVIGAMLISPLMGPIVELGMGLAIGSPFLVLRSFVRVIGSVTAVVVSAALITLLLPFHEITSEIAARTSPTVLDLLVAVCCAIAAAYAVVRPASDTTTTAAGTAIGIALVPPLCVVGYGLGTRSTPTAGGASLLFTANLCAILLFAVISFVLLGYGQVDVTRMEDEAFQQRDTPGISLRAARFLGQVFSSKYGRLVRFVMPLVLLIAVYIPLRRALEEVSWEVSVRTTIQALLRGLPTQSVQSSVVIERHQVEVGLVMVGKEAEAAQLKANLVREIKRAAGVTPSVRVLAVPDAQELRLQTRQALEPAPVVAPPRPDPEILRRQVDDALQRLWPAQPAGPILSTGVTWQTRVQGAVLDIVHLGPALGAAGEQLLAKSVADALGAPLTLRTHALPAAPITAEPADALAWVTAAARTMTEASELDGVFVCIERPAQRGAKLTRQADDVLAALTGVITDGGTTSPTPLVVLGRDAGAALYVATGTRWSLRLSTTPCSSSSSSRRAADELDGGSEASGDAQRWAFDGGR